jgi:hypothetical protein
MAPPLPVIRHSGRDAQIAIEERQVIVHEQTGLIEENLATPVQRGTQDLPVTDCQIRDAPILDT